MLTKPAISFLAALVTNKQTNKTEGSDIGEGRKQWQWCSGFLLLMEKRLTLIQTIATAGVFSAVSFWYGFMFGRESSRKELSQLIEDLRRGNPSSTSQSHS